MDGELTSDLYIKSFLSRLRLSNPSTPHLAARRSIFKWDAHQPLLWRGKQPRDWGSGNGVCGDERVGSGHISKVMLLELVCNCRRVSLLVAPPTIPQIYGHQLFFLQKSPSNKSPDFTDCRTLRVDFREHRMRDGLHRLRGLLLVPSLVELSSMMVAFHHSVHSNLRQHLKSSRISVL